MDATLLHQKHQKRFRDLEQGKYAPLAQDDEERFREFAKTEDRIQKIENIIQALQVSSGYYFDAILLIIQLLDGGRGRAQEAVGTNSDFLAELHEGYQGNRPKAMILIDRRKSCDT
jgi:hypothetical protein